MSHVDVKKACVALSNLGVPMAGFSHFMYIYFFFFWGGGRFLKAGGRS